MKEFLQAL